MSRIVTHSGVTGTKLFLFLFSKEIIRTKWNTAKHTRKKPPFLFSVRNPDRNGFYQRDLYLELRPIKVTFICDKRRLFVQSDVYLCKVTFICDKRRLFGTTDVYLCKVTFIYICGKITWWYEQNGSYVCVADIIIAGINDWAYYMWKETYQRDLLMWKETWWYGQYDSGICVAGVVIAGTRELAWYM